MLKRFRRKRTKMGKKKQPKGDYDWSGEEDHGARRNIALKEELIAKELRRLGLSEEGTLIERARLLEASYESERAAKDEPAESYLLRCHPQPPEGGGLPAADALGCLYSSPATFNACPFCGMTEVDVGPAPAAAGPPASKNNEPTEGKPSTVRVTAKDVKAKKDKRKKKDVARASADAILSDEDEPEVETPALPASAAVVPAKLVSPDDVKDEEALAAVPGASVAELDAQVARAKEARRLRETTEAKTFWEEGDALREIHDRKLWCLVKKHEDGSPVFRSFGQFVSETFDYSPGHGFSLVQIARAIDRETAISLGVYRSKTIVACYYRLKETKDDETADRERARLIEMATAKAENGASRYSGREIEEEIRQVLTPKLPPPPVETASAPAPPLVVPHDADGVVIEDADDEVDDRDDADEPESTRTAPDRKTVTVTLGDTAFVIPLYQKGSSVKAAKKIEDGAHGEINTLNGHKVGVELRIGDGGQLEVRLSVARPR
jgi:hypothetical protein